MTIGYGITLAVSLGLLILYFLLVKEKDIWMGLLFACVAIVNIGYFMISVSNTVEFAIFSNDIAYLGSVFLLMCMLFAIMRLCGFEVKRLHIIACVALGVVMFCAVATSGFLPWYYTDVQIETVDGATKLVKEYGVLHPVYLFYILGYFISMIVTIAYSIKLKRVGSHKFSGILVAVVCLNILVWVFEKFISWEFEFLSVTYISSEIILLLLYWMMQDYVHVSDVPPPVIVEKKAPIIIVDSLSRAEKMQIILDSLSEQTTLSARQMDILERILDGKSRKEIAAELHLSENTIKTHTGMLYKSLGVSGRDEIYSRFQK